jgi:UDP-GlcNAc:undecaprenyl-phosphate/decaprenyl-phosphate GlcNAc-1-phosphate transferase
MTDHTHLLVLAAIVFIATTVLSTALVPVAKVLALRLGVLDAPGTRKIHASPTPRLGGLAVFVTFMSAVFVGPLLAPSLADIAWVREWIGAPLDALRQSPRVAGKLHALLLGTSVIFLVGLVDDVLGRRFPVALKALGQCVAAGILIAGDVRTSFLPNDALNIAVTVLWIFGVTNAFNLLDNMDGLSAGVAFVAALVFLVNAWLLGETFISLLLIAFMGSLLGFLFYNWNPASIFLGDCGSLTIGYLMASLTLLERYVSQASSSLFPLLMPVLVLAVPIVDTTTVVVIRLIEGRPIYVGDNRHLSHRLLGLGFSHRRAAFLLYLLTFSLGIGAASLSDATPGQTALVLLQSLGFVAVALLLMFTDRARFPQGHG